MRPGPFLLTLALALVGLGPRAARAGEPEADSPSGNRLPTPRLAIGAGFGGTFKSEQLVVVPHVEARGILAENLALAWPLHLGFGDDYLTIRPSFQAKYYFRIGDFWVAPIAGASFVFYEPVGPFGDYCSRYGVHCSDFDAGPEVGGGIGYRGFGAEAYAGLLGLPLVTARATFTYSFGRNR